MNEDRSLARASITREKSERHAAGVVESKGVKWRFHAIAEGAPDPSNIDGGHVAALTVWRQGEGTAFRFERGMWISRSPGQGDLLSAVLALFD